MHASARSDLETLLPRRKKRRASVTDSPVPLSYRRTMPDQVVAGRRKALTTRSSSSSAVRDQAPRI
ncbi:hypothetical protein ACFPRL_03995 [Pseudoclavibacter helvolus]